MIKHKKEKAYLALKKEYLSKRASQVDFSKHIADKKQSLANI
jgi:hypothetical protein